jgi:hypothetical protein
MVEEVTVTLEDGVEITTIGDHLWEITGRPGVSRCQCGIYRTEEGGNNGTTLSLRYSLG